MIQTKRCQSCGAITLTQIYGDTDTEMYRCQACDYISTYHNGES